MLNEIAEFAQYTATQKVPLRLRYDALADNLSGIRRAMTIVARGALRGDAARLPIARNCLRLWCGYTTAQALPAPEGEKDAALYAQLEHWLPKYLRLLRERKLDEIEPVFSKLEEWERLYGDLLTEPLTDEAQKALGPAIYPPEPERGQPEPTGAREICLELALKAGERLRVEEPGLVDGLAEISSDQARAFIYLNQWKVLAERLKPVDTLNEMRRRLFFRENGYEKPVLFLDDEEQNDLHAVTFDAILADALDQGPLRRRYLVATACADRETLFSDVRRNKKSMDGSKRYVNFPEWESQLVKLTAMALLGRGAACAYPVQFNYADASNYIQTDVKNKGMCKSFFLRDEPIFTVESLPNSVCRLGVSEAWLDQAGWKLVEQDELKNYPGRLYYEDGDGWEKLLVSGVVEA